MKESRNHLPQKSRLVHAPRFLLMLAVGSLIQLPFHGTVRNMGHPPTRRRNRLGLRGDQRLLLGRCLIHGIFVLLLISIAFGRFPF